MKPCLCVIGARANSKRLKGKNKALVGGKPLYVITLEAAINSGVFNRIIFSTDDQDIWDGLESYPVIRHRRPKDLAKGDVPFPLVLKAIMDEKKLSGDEENICVLTPCHPFRRADNITEAYNTFLSREADSLVTITRFPCPPSLAIDMHEGMVLNPPQGRVEKGTGHQSYYPDGAIIFVRRSAFMTYHHFYQPSTAAHVLKWPEGLDIDEENDLKMAKDLADGKFSSLGI